MLLSGSPPFHCSSLAGKSPCMAMRMIDGHYHSQGFRWREIFIEAKDLIRQLLNSNPNERLSVESVPKHPWIASVDMTHSIALQPTEDASSEDIYDLT